MSDAETEWCCNAWWLARGKGWERCAKCRRRGAKLPQCGSDDAAAEEHGKMICLNKTMRSQCEESLKSQQPQTYSMFCCSAPACMLAPPWRVTIPARTPNSCHFFR